MRLKIVIIFFACWSMHFCDGQSKQNEKDASKTIYITKYDSNPPPLNFRSYGAKDGLPRGEVNDFVQTDDGFVWFSITNLGLVRFDGYHFKIFKAIEGDSTSLSNDNIFYIAKSHKKGLWLASRYNIIWFDLVTYTTRLIPLPTESTLVYYRLFEDSQQHLWVYFNYSLYLYEPVTNKFTAIKKRIATDAFTGEKINIENALFYNVKESENGDLFIIGNGLFRINPVSFEFSVYKKISNQFFFNTFIIDEDKKHIWFSGWKGLLKYNYKNDSLVNYNFQKMETNGNLENHIFVSSKNNNQLWLSNELGIRVFDKNTGAVTLYKKNNNENLSVTEISAKGINGIEWFWNHKTGFSGLLPDINRFNYHKLLPADEQELCEWDDTKNNTLWFGSQDRNYRSHLYKYNCDTKQLTQAKVPVREISAPRFIIPLLHDTCLVAIANVDEYERRGTNYSKLFLLNTATNTLTHIRPQISNHNETTTDSLRCKNAYRDKVGSYWITTDGQGLIHYDVTTHQFFQYLSDPTDSTTLSNNSLYSMACGRENTVWTGSDFKMDNVLNKLDALTGKVQRIQLFAKNIRIDPLCEDRKGNVWVSTHGGLVCYNRYSGLKYQVPKFTDIIIGGHEDPKGNIILLADDGIWLYDPVKKFARRFDEQDGIRLEYFDQRYTDKKLSLNNDSIFISDSYRFPVSNLYPKNEVPPLHFTGIKILGKELTSTKNVDALDTVILRHNENQISFEFAALSFLSPERNIYACMLQGTGEGWQQLGVNNSITYANLSPGNYTFKIKIANLDGVWGKEKHLHIRIVPAFWQTTWFTVLIILIIGGFIYWLYRNRLNQVNLRNQLKNENLEKQKREAEFNRKLSEIELTALRSQMNPHFIFNCLNSIKLYTTQNDSVTASAYLTKFSRLLRQVLENSRNNRITLSSELDTLDLYMEMESMRFKEKLTYNISVEKDVDLNYIEVPPLLLQPYVENAIWHGLMQNETGGNISIVVSRCDPGGLLEIRITDNGIGRAKAGELKSKSAVKQKSFGMRVTSERIALINQLFNTNTNVQIIDLMHDNGEAAGTQVIIQISV